MSSLVPSFHFIHDSSVVVSKGDKSGRRALEVIEASDGRAGEASKGCNFLDIMGRLKKQTGGESEGFTFADILQRADFLSETVLEALVDTFDLPLC